MICFGVAAGLVFVLIDVDAEFILKEFGEGSIGEVEHIAASHAEHFIDETHFRALEISHDHHHVASGARDVAIRWAALLLDRLFCR
jgi:hypothetical protein